MVEVKLLVVKIKDGRNKTFTFTLTGAAAVTSFLLDISWNQTLFKFDETTYKDGRSNSLRLPNI